ncbi:MAG: hypothetical protein AAGD07_08340 [Planctomycetota bacterium]
MTRDLIPVGRDCCSLCRATHFTSLLTLAIVACLAMQQTHLVAAEDAKASKSDVTVDAVTRDSADAVAKTAEAVQDAADHTSGEAGIASKSHTGSHTGTLSVAPSDHVEYPTDRPSWVGTTPQLNPDSKTMVVTSGFRDDREIADETLQVMIHAAIDTYVQRRMESMTGPAVAEAAHVLANDRPWIEDKLITRRYQGEVKVGDAARFESAVMLTLDDAAVKRVNTTIRGHQVGTRLLGVGVFAGIGFLGLLSSSIVLGNLNARRSTSPSTPAS